LQQIFLRYRSKDKQFYW